MGGYSSDIAEIKHFVQYVRPSQEIDLEKLFETLERINPALDVNNISEYYRRSMVLRLVSYFIDKSCENLTKRFEDEGRRERIADFALNVRSFCVTNIHFSTGKYQSNRAFFEKEQENAYLFLSDSVDKLALELSIETV